MVAAMLQERPALPIMFRSGRPMESALIQVADYPQLQALCWNRRRDATVTEQDALQIYDRNWRHVDTSRLEGKELALIRRLRSQALAGPSMVAVDHGLILDLIGRMNLELLTKAACFLGGANAIAMDVGAYRTSDGICFLCSSRQGWSRLRTAFFESNFEAFFPNGDVSAESEFFADQSGIHGWVSIDRRMVKIELITESRVDLEGHMNEAFGVLQLGMPSMFCEMLMTNADRGSDLNSMNRDILDILMMERRWGPLPEIVMQRAVDAYGPVVQVALEQSRAMIGSRVRLDECCHAMEVPDAVKDELIDQLGAHYRDDRFSSFLPCDAS